MIKIFLKSKNYVFLCHKRLILSHLKKSYHLHLHLFLIRSNKLNLRSGLKEEFNALIKLQDTELIAMDIDSQPAAQAVLKYGKENKMNVVATRSPNNGVHIFFKKTPLIRDLTKHKKVNVFCKLFFEYKLFIDRDIMMMSVSYKII